MSDFNTDSICRFYDEERDFCYPDDDSRYRYDDQIQSPYDEADDQ